jgi:NADH:ubiquinone oxidoreductase subunit 6 (subunit J)
MLYLKLLIIIIIISIFINLIFIFNKTAYTLISSVLVFLFVSCFFLFLELEFIAIAFAIVYIGGIAVMFLFLILVIDVRIENTKNLFFTNNNYFIIVSLTIFLSFLFSILYIQYYDPFVFNSFDFSYHAYNNLFLKNNGIYYDKLYFINNMNSNFIDIYILGFYLLKFHSLLIILIGFYLFVATIVSIVLCTIIFKYNIK